MSRNHMRRIIVTLLALASIAVAAWRIAHPLEGLVTTAMSAGTTPVTLFARAGAPAGPAVVVAHGFTGSRQLMHPFAVTLAQAGYRVLVFDFPGHGRNPQPLTGSITDESGATEVLVEATLDVMRLARALPGSDGRLALLGHSMASDIVIRAAARMPGVSATVAVSMFSPAVSAESPRNLLVVVGEWEPQMLRVEARRVLAQVAGDPATRAGHTYGDFDHGNARRLVVARGAEHIGVLYAQDSLVGARDWFNQAFAFGEDGSVDRRGGWLALLVAGIVALAWPLASLLPRACARAAGANLRWPALWPAIVVPAIATPLLLAVLPTDFLPVLVGDYLAAHFGVYDLITALCLWLTRRSRPPPQHARGSLARILAGRSAVAIYALLVLGGALNRTFASFWPTAERVPLVLAMFAGTLPFFLVIEWLTRGEAPARGGHVMAKAAFLASLALAVALDPQGLFFLIIIVPAILVFFLIYGLFTHWAYARTRHPGPGAIGNAVALAAALAATFPMLGG